MPSPGLIALVTVALATGSAAADPDVDAPSPPHTGAAWFADDDAFTPTVARAGGSRGALAFASAQWDSVRDRAALDVAGELHVWGRFRIVARVSDVTRRDGARPAIGVGYAFLDEARHGIAGTGYLSYKAEGWTAPDGELEANLAFARRLGPVRATVGIAYGQDPEGDDRDGEIGLAAHVAPIDGVFVGLAGRYRDALGSRAEETLMKRELVAGATATFTHGRYAVSALAGFAAVETATMPLTSGPAATVSLGAAF